MQPADLLRAFALTTTNYPRARGVPDLSDWMFGSPLGLTDEQMQHGDAFKKIPIVHAIVRMIQNDCAALPRTFYRGERELPRAFGNPVDVFDGANARDTGHQFRLKLFGDLELYADAFIYLERGKGRGPNVTPYAMWTLPPPLMKIVPGPNRTVSEYVWYGSGSPQTIEEWKIIHISKYNPHDEQTGITWVEAAREDWMAQWHALKVMRQFFARGGMTPGTWSTEANGRPLREPDIKRMQDQYARRFQGFEQLWKLIVVDGLKQVEKGQTISELQLGDMITLMNANLCRAAGVPPWMMGIKEAGSLDQGKSSETSSENYWRSTIGNLVRLVDSVMNERFCSLWGDEFSVETDMDGVPALQAARLEMLKGAVIAAEDAVVSINEVRDWFEYEETGRPEDDLPRVRADAQPDPLALADGAPAAPGAEADQPQAAGRVIPLAASTQAQRVERLRRRQDRRLAREEQALARLWDMIRDDQEKHAISVIRKAEQRMAERIEFDPSSAYLEPGDEERKRLEEQLQRAMAQAAEDASDEIGVAIALDLTAAEVANYVRKRVDQMIVNVSATDRARLTEVIADGIRQGKQWNEVVGAVREFFDGRRANSMTIARTEVAGPYNRASWMAWKAGGVRRKFWLSIEDDATRATHREAGDIYSEANSIGIGEPFIVGGYPTMLPGETGAASEDINCRCQVMPDLTHFEESIGVVRVIERGNWLARMLKNKPHAHANGNGKIEVMS
jgi:phage portal protein BeeE